MISKISFNFNACILKQHKLTASHNPGGLTPSEGSGRGSPLSLSAPASCPCSCVVPRWLQPVPLSSRGCLPSMSLWPHFPLMRTSVILDLELPSLSSMTSSWVDHIIKDPIPRYCFQPAPLSKSLTSGNLWKSGNSHTILATFVVIWNYAKRK